MLEALLILIASAVWMCGVRWSDGCSQIECESHLIRT
jgi:hypothetical protein